METAVFSALAAIETVELKDVAVEEEAELKGFVADEDGLAMPEATASALTEEDIAVADVDEIADDEPVAVEEDAVSEEEALKTSIFGELIDGVEDEVETVKVELAEAVVNRDELESIS